MGDGAQKRWQLWPMAAMVSLLLIACGKHSSSSVSQHTPLTIANMSLKSSGWLIKETQTLLPTSPFTDPHGPLAMICDTGTGYAPAVPCKITCGTLDPVSNNYLTASVACSGQPATTSGLWEESFTIPIPSPTLVTFGAQLQNTGFQGAVTWDPTGQIWRVAWSIYVFLYRLPYSAFDESIWNIGTIPLMFDGTTHTLDCSGTPTPYSFALQDTSGLAAPNATDNISIPCNSYAPYLQY